MASNEFEIKLLADTSKAVKSIEGLAKSALAVGASVVGILTLGKGIQEVVGAAIEAEESLNAMVASLKLAGDFSDEAVTNFENLADSIAKNSTLDDDYVLSLIAVGKNLGLTNEQTEKTVRAATDLSAALGVDARTAVEALTKAQEGNGAQIGRLIPQLKGLTEEQLKSGYATDFVAKRFEGAAANSAQTFGGALKQLQNNFGNLVEAIGGIITQNPFLIDSIKLLTEFFIELKDRINSNQSSIIKFTNVVLAGLIKGVGLVVEGFGVFLSVVSKVTKGIANLQVIIYNLYETFGIFKILGKIFEGIVRSIAQVTVGLLELIKIVSDLGITKKIFGSIGVNLEGLDKKIEETQKTVVEFNESFNGEDTLKSAARAQIKFFDSVSANAESAGEMVKQVSGSIINLSDKALAANDRVGKGAKIAAENLKNQVKAIKDLTDEELKKIGENPIKFIIDFAAGEFDGTKLAKGFQTAAISALGAATKGAAGATELISKGLGEAAASFSGLPIAGPVTEIVNLLAQGPDKVRETITAFIDQIPVVIENILLAIPALIETLGQKLPELINKVNVLLPRILPTLITTFARIAPSFAVSLATQMPFIATSFVTELVKQAPAIAQALIDAAKGLIPGGKAVSNVVSGGGGGVLGSIGKFFGFAEGGMVPQGFPNDSFPAALTSGEAIVPNNVVDKLEAFLNGQGSSQNVTINLQIGEQQLASVLLNLNRRGFRTS